MAKKRMTKEQMLYNLKRVEIEKRICWQSAWTAANLVASYTLWKELKFGAKRLASITAEVDRLNNLIEAGELDYEEIKDHLAGITSEVIVNPAWVSENDIQAKKGTFEYALGRMWLEPTNNITEYTSRHFTLFFYVMEQKYGFKEKRLNNLRDLINRYAAEYENSADKRLDRWTAELRDYCGLVYEMPSLQKKEA